MIDLAIETLLTLEEAAKRLLVSKAALHRWISHGSKGIRLEAIKLGSRWRTSEEALQRFGERLTPNYEPPSAPKPTTRQRQRQLEQIELEVDAYLGIRRCETCKKVIETKGALIPRGERLWCPKCLIKRKSASLGQRIRTFRWAATLSQQELSSRTGITVDNIRSYEFNKKVPPESHLEKLMEALGDELVSGYSRDSKDQASPSA